MRKVVHSQVMCGLSRVTGTMWLERHNAARFFKTFFTLYATYIQFYTTVSCRNSLTRDPISLASKTESIRMTRYCCILRKKNKYIYIYISRLYAVTWSDLSSTCSCTLPISHLGLKKTPQILYMDRKTSLPGPLVLHDIIRSHIKVGLRHRSAAPPSRIPCDIRPHTRLLMDTRSDRAAERKCSAVLRAKLFWPK